MRRCRWFVVFFSAAIIFGYSMPSPGAEKKAAPGEVILAELGDEKITLEDFNSFISSLPENVQAGARAQKNDVLDTLISRRLIYRRAKSLGLSKRKSAKAFIVRARREIMIRTVLGDLGKEWKISEKEVKDEYENNKEKYQSIGKVTAAHIMALTEKEARDLLGKLDRGGDFTELAKKYSLAPERGNGGSLGEMTKGQHLKTGLPAIIEETAFMLKAGTYSGVIKSQFGWHVVRTSEKSESRRIPFEEVRVSIEKSPEVDKRTKGMKKMLKQLKEKHKVKAYKGRLPWRDLVLVVGRSGG